MKSNKTRSIPRPRRRRETPPDLAEFRNVAYILKLLDRFWFEGNLPEDPTAPFEYFINLSIPVPSPLPENLIGIYRLSEYELQYLCSKLPRPAWTEQSGKQKLTSYAALLLDWQDQSHTAKDKEYE